MVSSGLSLTLFFYNPNIHPVKEYELRKLENIRYANKNNINFIDGDYDTDTWFERIKGLENEPERGERCTKCFDMRFERTALYAEEMDLMYLRVVLEYHVGKILNKSIRLGKELQIDMRISPIGRTIGENVGEANACIKFQKKNLYKQEYCGCIYSLRDTNAWRKESIVNQLILEKHSIQTNFIFRRIFSLARSTIDRSLFFSRKISKTISASS